MRIAIIDDEAHWRKQAEKFVTEIYAEEDTEIITFESGVEYLESEGKFDISLIDIEMPKLDGFETITKARKCDKGNIFIVLTTHTEMMNKGFIVNAFRYIDKIKMKEELIEALNSADILMKRNKKITINVVNEGEKEIVLKNIFYIETEKHNIIIHTRCGSIKCSNTMAELEEKLGNLFFYRCHNAYIVNFDEVVEFREGIAHISNGDKVEVSVRKRADFKKVYFDRAFQTGNA